MRRAHGLQVMLMTHCFTTESSHKQTVIDASVGGAKLASRTMLYMDDKYRSREKIGGYGVHRILKH